AERRGAVHAFPNLEDKTCRNLAATGECGGAWTPRLAKGMETLVQHVTQGFKAMPPRGLCMDCSAEDYQAIIHWMSE
ncbi:c-type cytochrome, partial [Pseudomonas sp. NPDC086278]|uniref:c-type cytochrome n=1 Tax=Pseudomonas sp. NPDC086278 TaxID=3390646 RepID=UPI003D008D8A